MEQRESSVKKIQAKIEPITDSQDFARFFDIVALTLGHQTKDGLWIAMNPGWDTPDGRQANISRFIQRWSYTSKDRNGNPNTIFLKAVVPREDGSGSEEIAGVAIWMQASMVEGYGDTLSPDLESFMNLETLYPGQPAEHDYLRQLYKSQCRSRIEAIKEAASRSPPAAMVLDLCVVDPAFQRRRIATKLVEWGLSEAKRRGGLECILEASSMGRHVYKQLGFYQDGGEFVYEVDEKFRHRDRPSNVFMRTGQPNGKN